MHPPIIFGRINLFKKIYSTPPENRSSIFLAEYNTLYEFDNWSKILNSYEVSLNNIFANDFVKKFTFNLQLAGIESLIGGSYVLSCVDRNRHWTPNDIDLYITNISKNKLEQIENILYQMYYIDEIYVVRLPITVTWYIKTKYGEKIKLQINIMNITSWAEIFINAHSDLVTVGYEIMTNKIIYMKNRFENIICKKNHVFSNILNLDTICSFSNATEKYTKRGYRCVGYFMKNVAQKMESIYKFETLSISSEISKPRSYISLFDEIFNYYSNAIRNKNIAFSSTVSDLFIDNEYFAPIKYLSIHMISSSDPQLNKIIDFLHKPKKIILKNGPKDTLNNYYKIGILCQKCNTIVSLHYYYKSCINSRYITPETWHDEYGKRYNKFITCPYYCARVSSKIKEHLTQPITIFIKPKIPTLAQIASYYTNNKKLTNKKIINKKLTYRIIQSNNIQMKDNKVVQGISYKDMLTKK